MNRFPAILRHPLTAITALVALYFGGNLAVSAQPVDRSVDRSVDRPAPPSLVHAVAAVAPAPVLADVDSHTGKEVHRKPALSALRARLIRRREKDDAGRLVSDSTPQAGMVPLWIDLVDRPEAACARSAPAVVVTDLAVADWGLPAVLLSRTGR